jgi:LuxR family transcriptional regulator, maltose regulon positive regulatory protein
MQSAQQANRNSLHFILATKLTHPPMAEKWAPRTRLISNLNECRDRRVTLISAPAGFGKTTFAGQWLAQKPMLRARLSLDPGDGNPERSLRYVVAAPSKGLTKASDDSP